MTRNKHGRLAELTTSRDRGSVSRFLWYAHRPSRKCGSIAPRDTSERSERGEWSRKWNSVLAIFIDSLSFSLFLPDSFLVFFTSFFYFAPSTEHVHGSGEHFRSARPGRRCAGEYLSERKTLCIQPSPFHPRAEGGTRGWQCGLFAEKSHSVGSRSCAHHIVCAGDGQRGMLRGGEKEIGYGGGKAKSAEHTRAEL